MSLTEAQARDVIAPWYRLFNQSVQGDMRKLENWLSALGQFRAK